MEEDDLLAEAEQPDKQDNVDIVQLDFGHLEIDHECDHSDGGTSRRSSSIVSTRSLHSDDLSTVHESGRTYPDYDYFMPSDAAETTRLSIVHRVFVSALGGSLTTVPLSHAGTGNPTGVGLSILDVGTGPGDWAIGIQEQWPDAEVIAVDVGVWPPDDDGDAIRANGHQEPASDEGSSDQHSVATRSSQGYRAEPSAWAHSQVQWEIDNLDVRPRGWCPDDSPGTKRKYQPDHDSSPTPLDELENAWTFSTRFDLVHIRGMKGVFSHWPSVYRAAYESLAPGGWIEVSDFMVNRHDVGDELAHQLELQMQMEQSKHRRAGVSRRAASIGSAVMNLIVANQAAARTAGRPLNIAHMVPAALEAAGFIDVWTKVVEVPIGTAAEYAEVDSTAPGAAGTTSPSVVGGPGGNATDERLRAAGKLWFVACLEGLEPTSLRLLTRHAGWTAEDVREVCEEGRGELKKGLFRGVRTPFHFVRARKPLY